MRHFHIDPEADTGNNGTDSHFHIARNLESRGYEVRANPNDNEHSWILYDGKHVGDIHGDAEATVTNYVRGSQP